VASTRKEAGVSIALSSRRAGCARTRARWPVTAAGPTGADGEEEGEAESGIGDDSFHEVAEDRTPAAAAVRAAPRNKRDMAQARAREARRLKGVVSLCARGFGFCVGNRDGSGQVEICESKLFVKIADILLFIFDFNMKVKYRYLNSISSIFLSVFIFVFEKKM
jgi:hypothetical protein